VKNEFRNNDRKQIHIRQGNLSQLCAGKVIATLFWDNFGEYPRRFSVKWYNRYGRLLLLPGRTMHEETVCTAKTMIL